LIDAEHIGGYHECSSAEVVLQGLRQSRKRSFNLSLPIAFPSHAFAHSSRSYAFPHFLCIQYSLAVGLTWKYRFAIFSGGILECFWPQAQGSDSSKQITTRIDPATAPTSIWSKDGL
jgi:hypothetical protein